MLVPHPTLILKCNSEHSEAHPQRWGWGGGVANFYPSSPRGPPVDFQWNPPESLRKNATDRFSVDTMKNLGRQTVPSDRRKSRTILRRDRRENRFLVSELNFSGDRNFITCNFTT